MKRHLILWNLAHLRDEEPMEFACGFIYVSPATGVSLGPNKIKRSALLPPRRQCYPLNSSPAKTHSALLPPHTSTQPRPHTPLLPPHTSKSQPSVSSHSGSPPKHTPIYENLYFHVEENQHTPTTHIVNAPSAAWQKHLDQMKTPPPRPEAEVQPYDTTYFCSIPEGTGTSRKPALNPTKAPQKPVAPPLPPRPSFMKQFPAYDFVLPSSCPPSSSSVAPFTGFCYGHAADSSTVSEGIQDKQVLPGNPNVLVVSLGRLVKEQCECVQGEPTHCSQCGSVLESFYDNVVTECYFCQVWSSASQLPTGCEDRLFLLTPDLHTPSPVGPRIIFCIGTSVALSTQFVQNAMLQCIQSLSTSHPDLGITLVTFSDVVTVHGHGDVPSRVLGGEKLKDSKYLREVGLSFPTPPPLSQTQDSLRLEIYRLQESEVIALGPAALVSVTMASKHPGSKVLLVTDGVANAGLGSLHYDTHTLVSSSIFYQRLGETGAAQGVSVSVVTVRGSPSRLNELGQLTDRTGGEVVIAGLDELFTELMRLIGKRSIATHCTVTLLLPTVMRVRGEREAGHRCVREVRNITEESEVTFQYGETEKARSLLSGRSVCVQLQVRFRRDGLSMLRVLTATVETTEDSSQILSSLRVPVLLRNVCQTTAALTLRGRVREALKERNMQKQLILRVLEFRQNLKYELMYKVWLQTTEPIFNKIHTQTHSLPDMCAVLMYAMKNCYNTTVSLS